jgi:hypothetical protein
VPLPLGTSLLLKAVRRPQEQPALARAA